MPAPVEFADFCSPAYRLDTRSAANSRMINLYLEVIEQGPRAGKMRMRSIPGLKTFTSFSDSPMRGLLSIDSGNRLFAVAGGTVYEVFADGTSTAAVGSIALSSHPVTWCTNGFQIAIASGGLLYLVNGMTGGGAQILPINFTDGTPVRAATVDFLDQYFIADLLDSKTVAISNLAPDGATWDPGNEAIKEGYSDNISRVFADNEQLWVFGFDTTEVWVDTGDLFPFARIQGAVLKIGCSAPYSVAGALGTRFWLWNGAVYSAYGLNPTRVSDYGVEQAIATYGNTADAEAFCQVHGGHLFYFLSFPSVGRTWVYDASTKAWHERGKWENGKLGQYRPRVYARAFGKDLVGDVQGGIIYEMDPGTYTDALGTNLVRKRICPYITEAERMIRCNRLIVDADTGVGLDVAPTVLGWDPQMLMRWSDNRGKTWSNELSTAMGKVGEVNQRIVYKQLGGFRIGRTFELTVSDPVPVSYNGAYLDLGAPLGGR